MSWLQRYTDDTTFFLFFSNATATTETYTLSLHDALPFDMGDTLPAQELRLRYRYLDLRRDDLQRALELRHNAQQIVRRSEEHTSELQSQSNLVCRLLLEKKKNNE